MMYYQWVLGGVLPVGAGGHTTSWCWGVYYQRVLDDVLLGGAGGPIDDVLPGGADGLRYYQGVLGFLDEVVLGTPLQNNA